MGIRMVLKLKFEHISLTLFSKMRVDLAAQVGECIGILQVHFHMAYVCLSSKWVSVQGGWTNWWTGDNWDRSVGMVEKFFAALNVHNFTHGKHLQMFQMPYTSGEDMHLKVYTQD